MTVLPTGELPSPYVAADFPAEELVRRIERVREEMKDQGVGTLLLASPENIYYLLGLNYQGYFAFTLLVLAMDGPPMLIARAMERHTLGAQLPGTLHVGYEDDEDPADAAAYAINRTTGEIGVERAAMFFPVAVWERVHEQVRGREWVDASGLVENVRAVKSPAEIVHIRRAAAITDLAVQAGMAVATVEQSERAVASAIYHEMIRSGSEHPGFAPFIRSTDILHHEHVTWRDHPVRAGAGLFMELSACVYRYHAPITRMVYAERLPPGVAVVAETALKGLDAIVANLRPGAVSGDVYAAWERTVGGPGRHHCGYMIGIGFPPSWVGGSRVTGLRPRGTIVIEPGMVFHVQSWILGQPPAEYCISDTAVVTEEGCELLTTTPREPRVVPDLGGEHEEAHANQRD